MANSIQHHIIFKDGSNMNGEVLVKTFLLKLSVGTLKLARDDIHSIEYKNAFSDTDIVQVKGSTRLKGALGPSIIPVRFENTTQILKIPKADILAIYFFNVRGKVSVATRRALRACQNFCV